MPFLPWKVNVCLQYPILNEWITKLVELGHYQFSMVCVMHLLEDQNGALCLPDDGIIKNTVLCRWPSCTNNMVHTHIFKKCFCGWNIWCQYFRLLSVYDCSFFDSITATLFRQSSSTWGYILRIDNSLLRTQP